MDMTTHPARDTRTEQWLDKRGAAWTFELRPITDFDVAKSLKNQARLGNPIDKALAEEYRLQRQRGDVAPAVIAYLDGTKLVLIGGNHRMDVHVQMGDKTIPVYVVKAEKELLIRLTFEDNIRGNGKRPTDEERRFQAIYLIDALGATVAYAAESIGLSESTIKGEWDRFRADSRAKRVGLDKSWDNLSGSIRSRLVSVRTDEGFSALAQIVAAARLTTTEVGTMVAEINKHRSSREQQEYVTAQASRLKARIQGQGGTGGGTSRRRFSEFESLVKFMNGIEKLFPPEVARTARQAGGDLEEFQVRLGKVADRILAVMVAIDEERKAHDAA